MKSILGIIAIALMSQGAYAQRAPCAALPGGCNAGNSGTRPGDVNRPPRPNPPPADRPSPGRPGNGGDIDRPGRPPGRPGNGGDIDRPGRPPGRPGNGGDIDRPGRPPGRPGNGGDIDRPGRPPGRPGNGGDIDRPGRPPGRPGHGGDIDRPGRPGFGGDHDRPGRPPNRPGRPSRPGFDYPYIPPAPIYPTPVYPVYPDPIVVVPPPVVEPLPQIPSRPVVLRPVISEQELDRKLYNIRSYEQDVLYWNIQLSRLQVGSEAYRQASEQLERVAVGMVDAIEEALVYTSSAQVEELLLAIELKAQQYPIGSLIGNAYQESYSLVLRTLPLSVQGDIYLANDFELGESLGRILIVKASQAYSSAVKSRAYADAAEAAFASALDLLKLQESRLSYSEKVELRSEYRGRLADSTIPLVRSFYNEALLVLGN